MQIFIKTLTGKHYIIEIEPNSFIQDIKQKIKEKNHIPIQVQRLLFSGKQLENQHTLVHYSIKKNSTVQLLLRFNGGIVACEEPTSDSNDNKATTRPIKTGHIPSKFIS